MLNLRRKKGKLFMYVFILYVVYFSYGVALQEFIINSVMSGRT